MKRRQLVGALGLVSSAGCLRFATGGDGTETPTGTSTPFGEGSGVTAGAESTGTTEEGTVAPADVSYPLGLSEDGVEALLADAHLNELVGRSFQVAYTTADLTHGRIPMDRTVLVDNGSALAEMTYQGPVELYSSANGNFWREDLGDIVTYGQARGAFNLGQITLNLRLRHLINAGAWKPPTPEERDGRIVFRIQADGVDEPNGLKTEFQFSSLEAFVAEGLVDDEGIIRSLSAEYEGQDLTEDGGVVKWQFTYELGSIGEVAVSEPDWLATAEEEAPEVDAAITDDQQFIEMEFISGNPILPDTRVVLLDRESNRNLGVRDVEEAFEAGSTIYFWMQDDGLQWQRGSRPSDISPQLLDGRYGFWMLRGSLEYFGGIELG